MKKIIKSAVFAAGLFLLAGPSAAADLKVVVPGVHAYAGVPAGTAEVLSDLLLEALLSRHGVIALGPSDVRSVLNAEQQKNLLGCSDQTCMSELAGAMGADWLIAGSVGRLEDLYVLSLQLIDAKKTRVTSRANVSLKEIKSATEKMGPLVDKLLGARPQIRSAASALHVPPPVRKKALDRRGHCQLVKTYIGRVAKPPDDSTLVSLRRDILEDLAVTRFQRLFNKKLTCFWPHHAGTEGQLNRQLRIAPTDAEAQEVKRRMYDFAELEDQIKLVEEEYKRGLEMEKNGTGPRLAGLPFSVQEAAVPTPDDSPELQAFQRAYHESQKVLGRALRAIESDDEKAFLACFVSKKKAVATPPANVFSYLRKFHKLGYKLELCPLNILYSYEITRSVSIYKRKGEIEGCWRKHKGTGVSTDRVNLIKHQGEWRVKHW